MGDEARGVGNEAIEAGHQVFISYSSRDRERADAACAALEGAGLRCWIAPRDGAPGVSYASFLVDAISASRIVVLVFSRAANDSDAVLNELELAANRGIPVLPLRIEPIEPQGAAEFYLRRRHWLDAYRDFEQSLTALAPAVRTALVGQTTVREPQPRTRQSNLPRRGTSFVGRNRELAELGELVATTSLVTIVGAGGVGKTRLALQVALDIPNPGDGPWLVDLAPVTSPGLVASTILTTIGAAQVGDREPLDQLITALRDRHTVLVLDNCEHVVAEAADIAGAIVAAAPNVSIIATSREPLNLHVERIYRLNPMDATSAVRLFDERARAANPLFELNAGNLPTVEAICTQLDGLALAIELAAARIRVISVDELSRRLSDRFRLLTGGNRSAPPHQQTMRALIDWSYETLADDERALFRRVGAFTGSFSLDALTEVAAFGAIDDLQALDLVSALVDKSLVIAEIDDRGQRYHMLQSIHDYAIECLAASGESSEIANRHAAFFAALAGDLYREWDTLPGADWLDRARAELNNFRAALAWLLGSSGDRQAGGQLAADAVPLFLRTSLLEEGIMWCERALAQNGLAPATEAWLHYGLSMLYNNRAAMDTALGHAERAVELFRGGNHERALIRALSQQAQQTARTGRHAEAIAPAAEAVDGARRLRDHRLLAATLQRCALTFPPAEIERSRAYFDESAHLFRGLGRDDETMRCLEWWAVAETHAECFERAIDLAREASDLGADDDRLLHQANIVAACALAIDDLVRARPAARDMFELAQAASDKVMLAVATGYFAALSRDDDPELAARLLGYSEAQLDTLGVTPDVTDRLRTERLETALHAHLGEARTASLRAEGALWDEKRALAHAGRI